MATADYTMPAVTTLTFAPGDTAKTLGNIVIAEDDVIEDVEFLTLALALQGATINTAAVRLPTASTVFVFDRTSKVKCTGSNENQSFYYLLQISCDICTINE